MPASFHCRYDVSTRSYLYKLAILPRMDQVKDTCERFHSYVPFSAEKNTRRRSKGRNDCVGHLMALSDSGRIYNHHLKEGQSFNFDLFKECLLMMEGTHNFSNFSKIGGLFKFKTVNGQRYTKIPRTEDEKIRVMTKIEVTERPPPLPDSVFPLYYDNDVRFIDVVIQGESFLYNQVRRMVGAALAVATGKCDIEYVAELVRDPDKGWPGSVIYPAGARGLYLARVDYRPGALDLATDVPEQMLGLEKVEYDPHRDKDSEESCDPSEDREQPLPIRGQNILDQGKASCESDPSDISRTL